MNHGIVLWYGHRSLVVAGKVTFFEEAE